MLKPPILFWLFKILVNVVTLLLTGIIFDMAHVLAFILIFLYNLSDIDSSDWITSLVIFFMEFVFLESLGLKLTLISSRKILVWFILISILMLFIGFIFIFLSYSTAFWIPGVNFAYFWGWLEAYLCFYIDCFFYYFFPQI